MSPDLSAEDLLLFPPTHGKTPQASPAELESPWFVGICISEWQILKFLSGLSRRFHAWFEVPKGVVSIRGSFQACMVSQKYWNSRYFERGGFKDVILWFLWFA